MIRKANAGDAAAIVGIYNYYVTDTTVSFETEPVSVSEMERRINDISAHFPYYVMEVDGIIIGYAYAHEWKERSAYSGAFETMVYIDRHCKGNGYGRQLMERVIDGCREIGAHALIACITADNTESLAFHRRLGFEPASRFRQVGRKFNRWLDVIDMELILPE